MEYQASLIRHRLDTAKTTSDVSDVNPSEDENSSNPPDDNSTIAYQLAKGRMRRRMWGWQSRWIGIRILALIHEQECWIDETGDELVHEVESMV